MLTGTCACTVWNWVAGTCTTGANDVFAHGLQGDAVTGEHAVTCVAQGEHAVVATGEAAITDVAQGEHAFVAATTGEAAVVTAAPGTVSGCVG
jgi:hypothetical protein